MRDPIDLLYGVKARLTKRRFVANVFNALPGRPKALLHYKTDPLFNARLVARYTHTNNWEIIEICRVLSDAGFWVDLVDRAEADWTPADEYALFIGNGSGRAGWRYEHYAASTPSALRVFYATSPESRLAASRMLARYAAFESRTGIQTTPMRVPCGIDAESSVDLSDFVFCFDGNGFAADSYKIFERVVYPIVPSTSPAVHFEYTWLQTRDPKCFLCFAGDGFVVKGVDLVVEAFARMPHLTLHIAGPRSDVGFWEAYGSLIANSPNIHYEGFARVSGNRFKELCGRCSFVILPSASEAACTSIATSMRAGLVPITTYSTNIDDGTAGFLLTCDTDELIDEICEVLSSSSALPKDEYSQRVGATRKSSSRFSQAGFTTAFSDALYDVLSARIPVS